jgi:hypothetical protein
MAEEYPDIAAIESELKTTYADRDALIKEMRDLRFMENEPEVPAIYEAETVRTPIAYQIIERMVGTLTAEVPIIRVPPAKEGDAAMQKSSAIERGTSAILHELTRQQDDDVLERFIECLLADGHGCMRMLYAPQIWRGFPKRDKKNEEPEGDYNKRAEEWKRGRPLPLHWAWVDPLNVYPRWSEVGLEAVLESDYRDIAALNFGSFNIQDAPPELHELERAANRGSMGRVKFTQLWTRDTLTYAVDDVVVHHQKHRYQHPPYVYAYGLSPSTTEVKYKGLSILFPLRHILPQLDRVLSQKATSVRLWCWPTPVVRSRSPAQILNSVAGANLVQDSGIPRSVEIRPGQIVTLYEDEDISFLTWQGNGPDADEMISLLMQRVEQAGLSDVLYGQSSSGDSGYMINQLIAAARMKFKPIVSHAERAMEQLIQNLWDIIEFQIKQPIYAYSMREQASSGWIRLSPEDLDGYRQVRVQVNPVLPTDTYARSSQAINEVRAGLRSVTSAMEMIGVEQPDEMERAILWDEFKRDPAIRSLMVQEVAKRYGIKMAQEQAPQQQMGQEQLMSVIGQLPPALQQAILSGMMAQGQQMPQGAPGAGQFGPQVMAAPNVQAIPPQQAPSMGQVGAVAAPSVGPQTRPAGIATGRAPGVRRTGSER